MNFLRNDNEFPRIVVYMAQSTLSLNLLRPLSGRSGLQTLETGEAISVGFGFPDERIRRIQSSKRKNRDTANQQNS